MADLFLLGGMAAIVYGVGLQNRAGAFIVGGVMAVVLGISKGFETQTKP